MRRFLNQRHHLGRKVGILMGLVLICWAFLDLSSVAAYQNDPSALDQLKHIESQVAAVVEKNMSACVAVSDGTGFGSGVIISADGLVLTAGHVISEASDFELIMPSGKTLKARRLGMDLGIDAGMMQITSPGPFPFVELDRSGELPLGTWVVSMGHSGGYELGRTPPVRTGRVLGKGQGQMFTDAVLIGGDSGGPLFDLQGKLVGIHSSIGDNVAENRHVTMPGFFANWDRMKAGEVWGELPELNAPRKMKRGVIGVRVDLEAKNCRIRVVNERSPASEAGLEVGDVVLEFNGIAIRDGRHLIETIKKLNSGDVCRMKILRDETEFSLSIQLK